MYDYRAKVLKVIDGDNVKVSIRLKRTRTKPQDLGCHIFIEDGYICVHENLRLNRINANERNTDAGKAAKQWLKEQLPVDMVVQVKTIKDKTEKYGRFLAEVTRLGDSMPIQDAAVAAGHARYWDGKGQRPT